MVRREEQPWESRATVVLDTRTTAHRGEGPTASFEWAVSAAASVCVHLQQEGYRLRMMSDLGVDVDAAEAGAGLILDQLADVRLAPRADIATLIERVRRRPDRGLVIGVFGLLTPTEAELLGALRTSGSTCVALLIDSTTWLSLPAPAREEADRAHSVTSLALLRSGWRVVDVRHGAKLAGLWPQVARGSQGFALRAAMAETVAGGVR
jgi:uncharacterized protein (DUF58 family)